jgi:hypothetical protein
VDTPTPLRGWRAWLAHAFAVDKYDESSLAPEEKALLQRIALAIQAQGMTAAAIFWVQSNRQLNWLFSQVLVAATPVYDIAQPFVQPLLQRFNIGLPPEDMPILVSAFEKRYSVEYLIQQLEAAEAGELEPAAAPETLLASRPEE